MDGLRLDTHEMYGRRGRLGTELAARGRRHPHLHRPPQPQGREGTNADEKPMLSAILGKASWTHRPEVQAGGGADDLSAPCQQWMVLLVLSRDANHRAVGREAANDGSDPWHFVGEPDMIGAWVMASSMCAWLNLLIRHVRASPDDRGQRMRLRVPVTRSYHWELWSMCS